jgi:hypothetical protein
MGPRPEEITTPHEMDDTNDNGRNNDNATTSEDGPETTDTTDTADAWAVASGYTPLSDLNNDGGLNGGNSYVMVSVGPGHNIDSDDDDGDDWSRGNAGPTGAFYVNPNVFGNSNDRDVTTVTPALNSSVEDINFDEIAASALSALDEEYQHTAVVTMPSDPVSSNEKQQEDEDLKIIAAGFDERREELQGIREQGGFIAQWEESDGKSSIGGILDKDPKKDDDVDTNAVRKAIKTLAVKNKDAPFQQKFAIWQQKQLPKIRQQQQEQQQQQQQKPIDSSSHKLIPTTSYEIFHEPTPTAESRLVSANLSRSATLAEAVVRLSLLSNFQDDDVLLIDIVGVDHVECYSASRIRNTFRPFVRWLEDYFLVVSSQKDRKKIRVHFRLIGRDLATTSTTANGVIVDLLLDDDSSSTTTTTPSSSSLRATATCHSGVYHEFWEEQIRQAGAKSSKEQHGGDDDVNLWGKKTIPDLAVAFNAGIWGYREWADTIQYLALQQDTTATTITAVVNAEDKDKNSVRCGLPMVITAYTLDECEEDQEVISQSIISTAEDGKGSSYRAEILWESERNPFGSQVIRDTKSSTQEYRENACWQAWLLGG